MNLADFEQFEPNGLPPAPPEISTPNGINPHRRVSQMAASVTSERSHSPVSRTGTPGAQHDPNIAPPHLFESAAHMAEHHHFHGSPSLPPMHLDRPSPRAAASLADDRHPDAPLTYDQLLAANTTLRTRVSELEVINMVYCENENTLRGERDDLKRKVDDLERQLRDARDARDVHDAEPLSKRPRRDEP
jgi:GATA-binding protein